MAFNNNTGDRLADYVGVAERLQEARSAIQSIISEPPVMMTDAMGYVRVSVLLNDGRSSTGLASFRLDLQGRSAQATNPLEDCETSAVGRALGMLGYGSKRSIASREEVDEANRRADAPVTQPAIRNPDHPASEQQVKAIYGSAKGAGIPPSDVDACLADYDPLTKAQASAIIDLIKTAGKLPPSPRAPKPASDQAIEEIGRLRADLDWSKKQLAEYIRSEGFDPAHLTEPQALQLIDWLTIKAGEYQAAQEQGGLMLSQMTDADAIEQAIAPRGAVGVGR